MSRRLAESMSRQHASHILPCDLQGHVVGMYLEQARTGNFSPVLSDALLRCKASLPWWPDYSNNMKRRVEAN